MKAAVELLFGAAAKTDCCPEDETADPKIEVGVAELPKILEELLAGAFPNMDDPAVSAPEFGLLKIDELWPVAAALPKILEPELETAPNILVTPEPEEL